MKSIHKASLLILAVGGISLLTAGCASTSIKELNAGTFVDQAKEIQEINSFHWTSYIGHSGNRVYLEYQNPALIGKGLKSTVYWTELSGLPEDVQEQIKEGKNPWAKAESRSDQLGFINNLPRATEGAVR